MGFTSGSGKPVMCAVIIATETLSVEDRLGIDIYLLIVMRISYWKLIMDQEDISQKDLGVCSMVPIYHVTSMHHPREA